MKLKYILAVLSLLGIFLSCSKDDDNEEPFDAAAQALIDDEALIDYLKTHYYIPAEDSEIFGTIDTILGNETPLYDQVEVDDDITYNDIKYKLYYLVLNDGVGESPTRYDSIFVRYRGFTLDSLKFDENLSLNRTSAWLSLTGLVQGWKYGMPNFRSGVNVSVPGEPITYDQTGKGILFFPSGLGYGEQGSSAIAGNKPLLFHIELAQVIHSDDDNDGVLTKDEDIDEDGEVYDDDTDEDGAPNFFDVDDDGDGVFTVDEDIDGDGNPMNDDTDSDGIKNYLDDDDDGDGTPTSEESTTDDADGDGTVDYLDPDTK